MRAIAFDTLNFAKKLKSANFSQEQAEAMAEAMAGVVEEQLATKQDLREMEMRLEVKLSELKSDLIKWIFGLVIGQGAFIAFIVKFLK